ncbi:MAG: hypothetical protein OEY06_13085 [Gammaproteobacteria bacterium]|nr:hypothetical protein [Gammaproteobacteria bacterium]
MNTKSIRLAVLPVLLSATFTASAADTLIRPRASLGFASYDLAFTQSGAAISDSSYMSGGFGVTIAQDKLYFDFAYNTSLGATFDNGGVDDDFNRTDLSLTVGTALNGGLSIFGGYKNGSTEYFNYFGPSANMHFDTSGLFFGAGISNSINDNSSISFNGAIALLDGSLTDDGINPYDATAATVGLSLGASYNYYLNNDSGFSLKGTYQSYNFVDWADANYNIPDTVESIIAVEASYFFNF